jgi:excinuclease ABC subunit A
MDHMSATQCPACHGQAAAAGESGGESKWHVDRRLHSDAGGAGAGRRRKIKLAGREAAIAGRVMHEMVERLQFLNAVGLGYISLDRSAATLSGGEGQRIRLATQIGSKLRGVLYVLDEPSIGLHHRDNGRLLTALENLRDLGNTVLVVEHDEETIRRADYVVDLGPGAGRHGGSLVAHGTPEEIMRDPELADRRVYLGANVD